MKLLSIKNYAGLFLFFASAALVGCGGGEPKNIPSKGIGEEYKADLFMEKNAFIGKLTITQASGGVLLDIVADGLIPGKHGMHFHEVGNCEDHQHGFKKAGAHVMPSGKPHGFLHPEGPHEGNLPNLIVDSEGHARVELYSNLLNLIPQTDGKPALRDADGSALIIHAKPDDHLTQPIGDSGDRVACAVIQPGEAAPEKAE